MSDYSLVLSDELLSVYFNFKQDNISDNRLLEKFLSYFHPPHLTNVDQLNRIGISDTSILQQLAAQSLTSQTLEELVKQTRYKFILNTESSDYPYVNINNDSVEKNFSMTFRIGENRDKAIQLITALCADAKFVLIYDSYICGNWRDTQSFFDDILPKKRMTLLHEKDHLTAKITDIKRIYSDWNIKKDRHRSYGHSHDRYLLIDNKIEIILSSGFQYLFATDKDLTCLIRYRE